MITAVAIPFFDLVFLLVKFAIAAVPAMLIVSVIFFMFWAVLIPLLGIATLPMR